MAALSSPSTLTQFVAAIIIEHHAEERGEEGRSALVGLKVVPALLRALQSSRHPTLRGVIATCFRHLARDAPTRRRIAEAGALWGGAGSGGGALWVVWGEVQGFAAVHCCRW